MEFPELSSFIDFIQTFSTEESCIQYLERTLWKQGIVSPFDSTSTFYKLKNGKYRCKNTGKNFTVKTNTIFHSTNIPLKKWFYAIWLITSHKKGISSIQVSKGYRGNTKDGMEHVLVD